MLAMRPVYGAGVNERLAKADRILAVKATLAAVGAALALAAVLTYPTIVHPSSMARVDSSDGRFSIWNVAWVAHALSTDPRHVFDANIFSPHTGTLAYSEPNLLAGAIAAPIYLVTHDPIASFNLVVYLLFVASFLSTWALVRHLTGRSGPALVAATAFAFAPCVICRTAEIQLLAVFVFPLGLLATHRFVAQPSWPRAVALGAALGISAWACGYYAIFLGLAMGLAGVWFAKGQLSSARYWGGLALAVVVSAIVVAPVIVPYVTIRSQNQVTRNFDPVEAHSYSADVISYLMSPAYAHHWWVDPVQHWAAAEAPWLNTQGADRKVLFPGLVAIALGLVGVVAWRSRVAGFYAALAIFGFWLSLGPHAGLYAWLMHVVPFMSLLRAPERAGVLVTMAAAVFAGAGVASIERRRTIVWLAPILVLLTAADLATPWKLSPVGPVSAAEQTLAQLPRGVVVDFPFPRVSSDFHRHTRAMFRSMWDWQPLVNGYSDYIPPDFYDTASKISAFPDPATFALLHRYNVRYVVWRPLEYGADSVEVLKQRLAGTEPYLRPIIKTDDAWLYEIVAWPAGS
jgi:hypothetical protein